MLARRLSFPAILLLIAVAADARVISYAPYTNRTAQAAVQSRLNRHFVLLESPGLAFGAIGALPPIPVNFNARQVVLYDYTGQEEPRVIYPQGNADATGDINFAAVRENAAGVATILVQANIFPQGIGTAIAEPQLFLSTDSGATFRMVTGVRVPRVFLNDFIVDVGGPYVATRYSPVRIGTEDTPFVMSAGGAVYAISRDATARVLFTPPPIIGVNDQLVSMAGSDATGSRFLVQTSNGLFIVPVSGSATQVGTVGGQVEGWITPLGEVYLDLRSDKTRIVVFRAGTPTVLFESDLNSTLFAIPTFDYTGAWIIDRGPGKPTTLYLNASSFGLQKQWEDITAPEVEALHAGASGKSLLIQVHRSRLQADQRLFKDPALAVWHLGEPAPRNYDELFMNEQLNKRFIHVDVDRIQSGEPFVFDSGAIFNALPGGPNTSPATPGGGGDVVQEWGVVRASLKQQLVLPAVGRTPGAYASFWTTDVIFHNPSNEAQKVDLRYVPNGAEVIAAASRAVTLTLQPNEIRRVEDVMLTLFNLDNTTGALFITPETGVDVTSRTYTGVVGCANRPCPPFVVPGTFGFGMNAIDVYAAAAAPRFPVSFAGAFNGANFRTNIVITDTSSRGTTAGLVAAGNNGITGLRNMSLDAVPNGQQQFNNINTFLGLGTSESGALVVQPTHGSGIASVFVVDNRTNDSTYFPPDLPAPLVRTIPVIGHVDGANNSRFRSDLYLFNASATPRPVTLQVTSWDNPADTSTITITLLGNEARVIRDVLQTLFARSGLARLRYTSPGDAGGVRVTSRTYSVTDDGGTYGFLMPPLNNFQSGTAGDTLEILGAFNDKDYRTNIGLVELSSGFQQGAASNVRIEIIDAAGKTVDSFTVTVPMASGTQLNDIFRARPMNVTGAVLIRVSPLSGMIGAYATTTDNRTNDSMYLAANLAAKE